MITFALSRSAGDPRLFYAGAEGYGMTPEHWDLIGKELGLDKPVVVDSVRTQRRGRIASFLIC